MRIKLVLSLMVVTLFCLQSIAQAQGRRGGVTRSALAQAEVVQAELELTDDQKSDLSELQGARGARGQGRRGRQAEGGERGQRGERGEGKQDRKGGKGAKGGDRAERGGDRAERGGRGRGQRGGGGGLTEEQVQEEIDKLSEILLEHQVTRLNEIYVQAMGANAVQDPMVAKALEISDDQKENMQELRDEMLESMRSMRGDSDDREAMREKMQEMNQEIQEKMMDLLSDDQKDKLEEMKGEAFDLPEDAMPQRRGRRGRGGADGRTDF